MLLRFTKTILMLLAHKLKLDFCQNLSKVRIFHPYIIDAFRLVPASRNPIVASLGLVLVAAARNAISEPFRWLEQGDLNKTEIQLKLFNIFSILIFNEFYLFT